MSRDLVILQALIHIWMDRGGRAVHVSELKSALHFMSESTMYRGLKSAQRAGLARRVEHGLYAPMVTYRKGGE